MIRASFVATEVVPLLSSAPELTTLELMDISDIKYILSNISLKYTFMYIVRTY